MTYDEWGKEPRSSIPINENCALYKNVGRQCYMKIHEIVAEAPDVVQNVWIKFEDKIKIGSIRYCGTPFFNPEDGCLYFNLNRVRKESYFRNPFGRFFHEAAHVIDYAVGSTINPKSPKMFSYVYKNKAFRKSILKETQQHLLSIEKKIKSKIAAYDGEWLFGHGLISEEQYSIFKLNGYLVGVSDSKEQAYIYLQNEILDIKKINRATISDTFGGATLNKINGGHTHPLLYWGKYQDSLSADVFANMFNALISSPEEIEYIKKYFPKSYKMFIEMMESIESMYKRGDENECV